MSCRSCRGNQAAGRRRSNVAIGKPCGGAPVACIERKPLLQQEIGQRFREIMPADIRRLKYAHGEPSLGELRENIDPAVMLKRVKLSTGNRYFWHVSVNTPLRRGQPRDDFTEGEVLSVLLSMLAATARPIPASPKSKGAEDRLDAFGADVPNALRLPTMHARPSTRRKGMRLAAMISTWIRCSSC